MAPFYRKKIPEFINRSLIYKVGIPLVSLFLLGSSLLLVSSYLTGQLMGTTTTINVVGMQRARVYKIASLLQQLSSSDSSVSQRHVLQEEILRWRRAMKSLEFEIKEKGETNPKLDILVDRYKEVQQRWLVSLEPLIEKFAESTLKKRNEGVNSYVQQADIMVEALSEIVLNLEESRERQIQKLYFLQVLFLFGTAVISIGAIILLNHTIRKPLNKLTQQAERLAEGDLSTLPSFIAPSRKGDEFAQLSWAFQNLVEKIQEKISEIEVLHHVGKEICTFEVDSSDQMLHRLANRAVELLKVDLSVLLVRHSFLQSWVIEAASGSAFNMVHKEIVLLEETPFANQAFDSMKPVMVTDLNAQKDFPVHFRDHFGAKSLLIVPLLRPQECVGVMVFLSTSEHRSFSDWEIRFAQHFSSYAAITIENARLFDLATTESKQLKTQLDNLKRDITELTHEVQAPAGRVAEFATWIEKDYGDRLEEKGRRYLDWIKREGTDLLQLAGRTTDLARLNAPNDPLQRVEVTEVIREVLELLNKEITEQGIEIAVSEKFPTLACRRIHLKQVMENLISNAIKFMGNQPTPRIEIGVEESEAGPLLFVRDNGIGMDPSGVEKVFRPFHRVGAVDVPGMGIGLAIVKTVIEQYGGSIAVTTNSDEGSTFRFRLPVFCTQDMTSLKNRFEC